MIVMSFNHSLGLIQLCGTENFVSALFPGISPTAGFLPDQKSQTITAIQKEVRLCVVRSPDKIASGFFDQAQIIQDQSFRHRIAEIRVTVMTAQSVQFQRLAVKRDFSVVPSKGSGAEFCF